MRNLIALALLCAASTASADFHVIAHDFLAGQSWSFASCELDAHFFEPGQEEASYLSMECEAAPTAIAFPGVSTSLPTSAYEELYILYGKNEAERLDCYLVRLVGDTFGTGSIVLECGDMHD